VITHSYRINNLTDNRERVIEESEEEEEEGTKSWFVLLENVSHRFS
jgi:hypothetical protein